MIVVDSVKSNVGCRNIVDCESCIASDNAKRPETIYVRGALGEESASHRVRAKRWLYNNRQSPTDKHALSSTKTTNETSQHNFYILRFSVLRLQHFLRVARGAHWNVGIALILRVHAHLSQV